MATLAIGIIGLVVSVTATAVSIGMSVDNQNKADKKAKAYEKKQAELSKKQSIKAVLKALTTASTNSTAISVSNIINEEKVDKINKGEKIVNAANPKASMNYTISEQAVKEKYYEDAEKYDHGKTVE